MVSGARILIVDDEPDICEEFAEYLEARGHHVDTAATVGAAHALLATGRPYSMVLLGNGRGTDVAIAARLALGNRALIVVITGQLTAETELAVREAGADQAMAKPIDPLALLALIATMPAL